MKKFLLAGAVVVFAGIASGGAIAADHKGSKPAAPRQHAAATATAKPAEHKESPRHHVAKHRPAHKVHKAHAK